MTMRRLMFCSMVVLCSLTVAAFAEGSRKSPFRGSPLAAPHHGSMNASTKVNAKPAKIEKVSKKSHFWNR